MSNENTKLIPRDLTELGKLEKAIYFIYPDISKRVMFTLRDIRNSEYTALEIENVILELEEEIKKNQAAYKYISGLFSNVNIKTEVEDKVSGVEDVKPVGVFNNNDEIKEEYKNIEQTEKVDNIQADTIEVLEYDHESSILKNLAKELTEEPDKNIEVEVNKDILENTKEVIEPKEVLKEENNEDTKVQVYAEVHDGKYKPLFSKSNDFDVDLYFLMKDFFLGGMTPRNYRRLGNTDKDVITSLINELISQEERGRR